MYALARPALFALSPHAAHAAAMTALAPLEHLSAARAMTRAVCANADPRLRVSALGLTFPSPLGVAGGFDKNAMRARALAALGFGHVELGTVTAQAQEANPRPNLFRLPEDHALVNRLGFPNEGAIAVCARIARRRLKETCGVPVGVSIGKSRAVPLEPIDHAIADYASSFREARRVADFVVVNVSSPNTRDLRAMQGAEIARRLLTELSRANDAGEGARAPILVKIAPDLSDADLEALLEVIDETGIAGVIATNTTIARAGLRTGAARVEAIGAGGLSGPPLRTRALEVVARVRARLGAKVTVIGVGGIESADDVLALLRAGADLTQMYTGFVYGGPLVARTIARALSRRLDATGAGSLKALATDGRAV